MSIQEILEHLRFSKPAQFLQCILNRSPALLHRIIRTYQKKDNPSSGNCIISIISNINLRLDISLHSATKKKPCCDSNRALLFSSSPGEGGEISIPI